MFNAARARLLRVADSYPLRLSVSILLVKGLCCDTLAQRVISPSEGGVKQDWNRTAIMAAYSGFCEAPLVFLFYSKIFPHVFGASRTIATICQMLVVENLFLWPLLIYPSYYMV